MKQLAQAQEWGTVAFYLPREKHEEWRADYEEYLKGPPSRVDPDTTFEEWVIEMVNAQLSSLSNSRLFATISAYMNSHTPEEMTASIRAAKKRTTRKPTRKKTKIRK